MTTTEKQMLDLLQRRQEIDQTPEGRQMLDLLQRRQEIDRKTDPGFTENIRWLLEATELLLRHQLELVDKLTE